MKLYSVHDHIWLLHVQYELIASGLRQHRFQGGAVLNGQVHGRIRVALQLFHLFGLLLALQLLVLVLFTVHLADLLTRSDIRDASNGNIKTYIMNTRHVYI